MMKQHAGYGSYENADKSNGIEYDTENRPWPASRINWEFALNEPKFELGLRDCHILESSKICIWCYR